MQPRTSNAPDRPRVVIIGGGFAGLAVARAMKGADAQVTIIDRQNHHVFQPLLYQVATASLSPAEIGAPIRATIPRGGKIGVVLGDVTGIDPERRIVHMSEGSSPYDYLVLAAGVTHDYFGNDQWARHAPGLKTLSDATEIRRRLLLAFETAEQDLDRDSQRAALTFAVVGGGPTGVELCGAISEIATHTLAREYRNIEPDAVRVVLFEGGDRLLPSFPQRAGERAKRDLEELGVEVHLNAMVTDVDADGVRVGDERTAARNTIWAAGVRASALTKDLGADLDRQGRVKVDPDLSVPGRPEIFAIGDIAHRTPDGASEPLPGVAQTAMQMGAFVGKTLTREIGGRSTPESRGEFRYKDKGSMAIIGKNRAVALVAGRLFFGFFAWLLWALVHIAFLVGFRNRIRVIFNWAWKWFTGSHDARLIIGDTRMRIRTPREERVGAAGPGS